jgi:hypothetical protein
VRKRNAVYHFASHASLSLFISKVEVSFLFFSS